MLHLLHPTDPRWVATAEADLDRLLLDHAHCELKAAQSALSVVARHGAEAPEIIAPLLALAKEETDHLDQVQRRLADRRQALTPPGPDPYVGALIAAAQADRQRPDGPPWAPLLDRLLVCALIEARSCERFKLLAQHLADAELRAFYGDLMASEARHFSLFFGLAEQRFGTEDARRRLADLARHEAAIAADLPLGPTVHG